MSIQKELYSIDNQFVTELAQQLECDLHQISVMNNLDFFKASWVNEKYATVEMLGILKQYPPCLDVESEECNNARALLSRLLAHLVDIDTVLTNLVCEETQGFSFRSIHEAAFHVNEFWDQVMETLNRCSLTDWEDKQIQLQLEGEPIVKLSRSSMVWFFFFDIIYIRGKLSALVRHVNA